MEEVVWATIENENEKQVYFQQHITAESAYFLVKSEEKVVEFIWVKRFYYHNADGSDWFCEATPHLVEHNLDGKDLSPYTDQETGEVFRMYEWCLIEGDKAYEIDCGHVYPFLPETFQVTFVTDDETEAIQYMRENHANWS